jgi:hypothetical protein
MLVGTVSSSGADPLFPSDTPTLDVGTSPRSLDLKDLNADGILDLLVITENGLSIRLGQGAGTFGTQTNYPTGISSVAFTTGDLNGDGLQDVVVANNAGANTPEGEGTVTVYLGTGAGNLAPRVDYMAGDTPSNVGMGDFDGDGTTDLVVASGHIHTLYIFPGLPSGGFGSRLEFTTAGTGFPTGLAVGDLNEDGRADVVVGAYDDGSGVGAVSVFLGTPGVFLGSRADHEGQSNIGNLLLTDMDHDGHLDVAAFDGSSLAIFAPAMGRSSHRRRPEVGTVCRSLVDGDGSSTTVTRFSTRSNPFRGARASGRRLARPPTTCSRAFVFGDPMGMAG